MEAIFNTHLSDNAPESTILPLFGGAVKPIEAMTVEEFDSAAKRVYLTVRESAFSRGLPVIIERNGRVIKEYADGHVELIN